MENFVIIQETRIRINTIKRYKPVGLLSLNIYYSASKSRIDMEAFMFKNEKDRNQMLVTLDAI